MNTTVIKFGGKERRIKFGMYAFERFQDVKGSGNFSNILQIFWGGICNGALDDGLDITLDEVSDVVEELVNNRDPVIATVVNLFYESNSFKKISEKADEAKKKTEQNTDGETLNHLPSESLD